MTAKEESSEDSREEQVPLFGARTLEGAKLPHAKQTLKPFVGFAHQAGWKWQGSDADTTSQKAEEEKQVSGTNANDDECSNSIWEPHIKERHLFKVPNVASDNDFPPIMPMKAVANKKK